MPTYVNGITNPATYQNARNTLNTRLNQEYTKTAGIGSTLLGAGTGALAGGLGGFASSKLPGQEDNQLRNTLIGIGIGAGFGGVVGSQIESQPLNPIDFSAYSDEELLAAYDNLNQVISGSFSDPQGAIEVASAQKYLMDIEAEWNARQQNNQNMYGGASQGTLTQPTTQDYLKTAGLNYNILQNNIKQAGIGADLSYAFAPNAVNVISGTLGAIGGGMGGFAAPNSNSTSPVNVLTGKAAATAGDRIKGAIIGGLIGGGIGYGVPSMLDLSLGRYSSVVGRGAGVGWNAANKEASKVASFNELPFLDKVAVMREVNTQSENTYDKLSFADKVAVINQALAEGNASPEVATEAENLAQSIEVANAALASRAPLQNKVIAMQEAGTHPELIDAVIATETATNEKINNDLIVAHTVLASDDTLEDKVTLLEKSDVEPEIIQAVVDSEIALANGNTFEEKVASCQNPNVKHAAIAPVSLGIGGGAIGGGALGYKYSDKMDSVLNKYLGDGKRIASFVNKNFGTNINKAQARTLRNTVLGGALGGITGGSVTAATNRVLAPRS